MSQPTFEDGPPVPLMVEGAMDAAMLGQLFRDLAESATVLSIREKRGPSTSPSDGSLSLDAIREQLLSGETRAAQIRYRFSEFEWTDTILAGPAGFRVVRCRHE